MRANAKCSRDIKQKCYNIPLQARGGGRKKKKKKNENACNDLFRIKYIKNEEHRVFQSFSPRNHQVIITVESSYSNGMISRKKKNAKTVRRTRNTVSAVENIWSYKIAIMSEKKNTYREVRKNGDQNLVPNVELSLIYRL